MKITKDAMQGILDSMPDSCDIEDIVDRIIIRAKIEKALDQMETGDYMTEEELDEEIGNWN